MKLSIVIPLHNEAVSVRSALPAFLEALPAEVAGVLEELLLVENGSTDSTLTDARALELRFPGLVRVVSVARAGYGTAIRHGIEQARGTHLTILECDVLAVPFLLDSIRWFRSGQCGVVVGSKLHPRARDRRPLPRRLMTRGFNWLLRLLLGYPGSDTHGLKSMDSALGRRLCHLAITGDEVFQTELVLLAWRLGCPVVEFPVEIAEVRPTPVRILRRVPKVLPVLWQLHRSLSRLPPRPAGPPAVVSS